MSSSNGNNNSSGINQNAVQSISQFQQTINQAAQFAPIQPYCYPNVNYFGNQWNPYMPVYTTPNVNCMNPYAPPQAMPPYPFYHPYLQQIPPQAFTPAPTLETGIQWTTPNSQHFINNSAHAGSTSLFYENQPSRQDSMAPAPLPDTNTLLQTTPSNQSSGNISNCISNTSSNCEVQSFGQGFVPPLLSDRDSMCDSLTETSLNTENTAQSLTSPSLSSSPSKTDLDPNPCEVQCSKQDLVLPPVSDQVSARSSLAETSPGFNAKNTLDNLSGVTDASRSLSSTKMHPSPDENPGHASKVSSTGDTLASIPRTRIASKKPEKRKYMRCKCPNCTKKGGKGVRFRNGKLQHVCHISDCSKVFHQPSHLREHLKNYHKRFVCAHCDWKFARKSLLSRHIEMHTLVRKNWPESSSTDGLPATTSLKIEIKKVLQNIGATPACPIAACQKVCSSMNRLKVHLYGHFCIEQSYACEWSSCGRMFTSRRLLQRHLKTHVMKTNFLF